jgi:hypothetical protein
LLKKLWKKTPRISRAPIGRTTTVVPVHLKLYLKSSDITLLKAVTKIGAGWTGIDHMMISIYPKLLRTQPNILPKVSTTDWGLTGLREMQTGMSQILNMCGKLMVTRMTLCMRVTHRNPPKLVSLRMTDQMKAKG